jgi:MFS family permease
VGWIDIARCFHVDGKDLERMTRNYYLLVGGFFISTIGDWFYQLALPLLVYNLTHSAMNMAITYGLAYAPFLLFSPFGGVIADRVDRRRFLIWGDLSSAIIVGLLTALVFLFTHANWLIWVIYLLAFLLASISPLYHPSFQSYLPHLVADEQLPQANSWLQSAENLVIVLGPLVGGIVIATLGSPLALLIDTFSFLGSALLLALIRAQVPQHEATSSARSVMDSLRSGFHYVWDSPILRYGSLLFLGTNFASTLVQANFVFFLVNSLHFNPVQIGITFASTGVGALVGALAAPWLLRRFQPGLILVTTTICAGLMTLLLLFAHNVVTVSVPWSLGMALSTINIVTWFTLRQRIVPKDLLGRVIATTRLIAFISIPVAAFVGGALLASMVDIYVLIACSALLRTLSGVVGFFTPLARGGWKAQPEVVSGQ